MPCKSSLPTGELCMRLTYCSEIPSGSRNVLKRSFLLYWWFSTDQSLSIQEVLVQSCHIRVILNNKYPGNTLGKKLASTKTQWKIHLKPWRMLWKYFNGLYIKTHLELCTRVICYSISVCHARDTWRFSFINPHMEHRSSTSFFSLCWQLFVF